MSSLSDDQEEFESAEAGFRAAFVRLMDGRPVRVPVGTPVTQNNVAREAGRDASAFKKKRYPELVREVQEFVAAAADAECALGSEGAERECARQADTSGVSDAARLREERDSLLVQLLAAKRKIFEQWQLIQRLENSDDAVIERLDEWREGRGSAKSN